MIVLKWVFPVSLAVLAIVHLVSCWRGDDDLRKPTKVALAGLALASSGLILPFLFVYNPVLLLIDFSWCIISYIYVYQFCANTIFRNV